MSFVDLPSSPLAPGCSPVHIHYRDVASGFPGRRSAPREGGSRTGAPIVFLHGGWGYEVYPFDRQIAALQDRHRIVIPDRTGYGASGRLDAFPADFHRRAAGETRAVVDALGLDRPVLWGHSDGAIIALQLALECPDRFSGVIAEAAHFFRRKPASRAFFEQILADPRAMAAPTVAALERDHGAAWTTILERHSRAWLRIGEEAAPDEDFYGGRLGDIAIPVLLVHGARDPRTEPGELDALRAAIPDACVLPNGGHSPHSERTTADEVTRAAEDFLANHCECFAHPTHATHPTYPTDR